MSAPVHTATHGSTDPDAPLVVLLHGRGSHEHEIIELAKLLPEGPAYVAVRAPIAQNAPMVARAMKQFSFMPKYFPATTSGPTCEFLLRNSGPQMVDLMMRAPGLRRMTP